MNARETGDRTVVVGAGGIGTALAEAIRARGEHVVVWSRATGIDATDPASLAAADATLEALPVTRVVVTTGVLHENGRGPERSWRELDRERLMHSFLVNAVAPVLVARALLPRLPRDRRAVFAALGARVGSIGDNRSGGWYGYRASKAALAQFVRTLSIELARSHPHAVALLLHPGTVDTPMSRPFQRGVPADRLFTAADAATRLLAVMDGAGLGQSGLHLAYDGTVVAP